MADIDPNAIPFVPDTSVALIEPDSGKPKTAFHDWMQSLYDWMKRSVVDLTTKVTTLTADLGDVSAAITEEATIRQTEDGILATQITTVDTKATNAQSTATSAIGLATTAQNTANNATASGQVYLAAKAGPAGSVASYGWYLTAGGAFAGMEAIALSGGGSAIGFTASQFTLTDSGTAQAVFAYSAGAWYFNVPIVIQSGASGARTIITNSKIEVYDASNVLRVAIGVGI